MKPGRKLDRKQTNRRQKHELQHRAKRWKCSKLAVILADMLEEKDLELALMKCSLAARVEGALVIPPGSERAEAFVIRAKGQLRRANREARRS